jgi:hypothetical protein
LNINNGRFKSEKVQNICKNVFLVLKEIHNYIQKNMNTKSHLEDVFENIIDLVQKRRICYERVFHHENMTISFYPEHESFSISIFPKEHCQESFMNVQQMVFEIFLPMFDASERNHLLFSIQVHDTKGYKSFQATRELFKGFIHLQCIPYWGYLGKRKVEVKAIVEHVQDFSIQQVWLMTFWNLRQISDNIVKFGVFGDEFTGAFFFGKRNKRDKKADDELLEDESVLLSDIYDENMILLLCEGDFGNILM